MHGRPRRSLPAPYLSVPWAQVPTGGYGEDKNLRFLVMTRLGPDVEAAQKQSAPWSVARKAGYARLMLDLIRSLHEKCKMIFVDVKPGAPGFYVVCFVRMG